MPEPVGNPRSAVRGRRLVAGGVLGAALVLGAAAPAWAEEVPAGVPGVARPQCVVADPQLPEISGLAVDRERMFAINDGGDQLAVHVLDAACSVVDVRTAPVDPFDPEDLALAPDGTLWIADVGDNRGERPTVALFALRPDGATEVYRLAYPDGPHDAEALLLAPDGTPYLVTKEVLGASAVYRPVSDLVAGGTVGLGKVTTVNFTLTGTDGGPVGRAGQLMVTGGAVSADGRLLALRTYTDAYVWSLSGSDVVAALAREPVRVALPAAPQGEAISFAGDHRQLLVAGEGLPSEITVVPTGEQLAPAAASGTADPAAASPLTALDPAGSPLGAGLIAAAVATLVVWLGGKFRRGV